jgi:hypothetical protein
MTMDSKRIVGMVMILAACLFSILLSTAFFSTQDTDEIPYWFKGLRATGKVVKTAKDRITITLDQGKEMTFQFDTLTKIVLLGNMQLTPGALVMINYKNFTDSSVPPLARRIKQLPEDGTRPVPPPSPKGQSSVEPAAAGSPETSHTPSPEPPTGPPPGPSATTQESGTPGK